MLASPTWFWLTNIFIDRVFHYTYITWRRGWHTWISAPRWHESPGALCHPMPKAEGNISSQGFRGPQVTLKPWQVMSPSADKKALTRYVTRCWRQISITISIMMFKLLKMLSFSHQRVFSQNWFINKNMTLTMTPYDYYERAFIR